MPESFEAFQIKHQPAQITENHEKDQPVEQDACHSHFFFVQDSTVSTDLQLGLKYQWFIGERPLSIFVAISGVTSEVYWPKHEDIGKFLKVECTPILGETEYPPIFAISSPVSRGSGIPKVVNLEVHGELVEGNIIKGFAEVAWCGGTPGKGVARYDCMLVEFKMCVKL
ncbi:hypothetical protein WN944_016893 [Citrus x changshan-huyou]|uniref:AIR9-like A9 domain-containing protein n=1 Tax=Citrus x changshan-huyou TaxID=2935761 RepID=A0AAP0MCJ9_9ROSI